MKPRGSEHTLTIARAVENRPPVTGQLKTTSEALWKGGESEAQTASRGAEAEAGRLHVAATAREAGKRPRALLLDQVTSTTRS
jgi:hypothetical protein